MLHGCLVAESLRVGAAPLDVPVEVNKIWRGNADTATVDQPTQWTLLEFQAPDADADRLAAALAACLAPGAGWYVDFATDTESFVIFPGRVFRYPRHDPVGRAEAQQYARTVGVPEQQLDWRD